MRKFIAALFLLCASARAFEVYSNSNGDALTWYSSVITYRMPAKITKLQRRTIVKALSTWSAIIHREFVEVTENPDIDMTVDRRGFLPFDYLGMATVNYNGSYIIHAAVEFNWRNAYAKKRLYAVALHEIGHSLGLAHSPDAAAIMNVSISDVNDLQPDDIAGAEFLYGN